MAYQKRNGDIAIFAAKQKTKDTQPDWKGEALIDGVTYEVAMWRKGENGTMLAGSIKIAAQRSRDDLQQAQRQQNNIRPPLDDDIPF